MLYRPCIKMLYRRLQWTFWTTLWWDEGWHYLQIQLLESRLKTRSVSLWGPKGNFGLFIFCCFDQISQNGTLLSASPDVGTATLKLSESTDILRRFAFNYIQTLKIRVKVYNIIKHISTRSKELDDSIAFQGFHYTSKIPCGSRRN